MSLFLTGCPCSFPRPILVNESITEGDLVNETVVDYGVTCASDDCKTTKVVPTNLYIQRDSPRQQIEITRGRGNWCYSEEDDDELVWYKNGVITKKLRLVCDTVHRGQYTAYLYNAYGEEKKFSVEKRSEILTIDLDKVYPLSINYKADIKVEGDLPDSVLFENLQIIAYQKNGDERHIVHHKMELIRGCEICGESFRKNRYDVRLAFSTGVTEIVWYNAGVPFQTLEFKYRNKQDKVVDLKAILNGETTIPANKIEDGNEYRWKINVPEND